jgi:hypothetical protein
MGVERNTHVRDEKHTIFCPENLMGRDHSEDLSVDGKMMKELILRK